MDPTTQAAAQEPRTYGNWRRPRPPGLWHLGLLPTFLAGASVVLVAITMGVAGLIPGLIVLASTGVPLLIMCTPSRVDGRTRLQRLAVAVAGSVARSRGQTVYRSGPLGPTVIGTHQLPGLLAASVLSEAHASSGRRFALIAHPHVRHLTVVIETEPDGASLADQSQVDQWVAHYGQWLAGLTREPGLIACAVSVETAPDPGTRLASMLASRRSANPPAFADAVIGQVVDSQRVGAARVNARVALTYRMTGAAGKKISVAAKAQDIGVRLPHLTTGLHNTGAGGAQPVDAQRMCEIVRSAYDPALAETLEQARATGVPAELDWANVGPVSAQALPGAYLHEGAASITWEMAEAPRSAVLETVLSELLSPHPQIARKRVTLLYRLLSPAEQARVVESDLHNAEFRVNTQKKPTARALRDVDAARATAHDEARGSELLQVGMLVTATVLDPDELEAARAAVENLAPTARVNLRVVTNSQDSAFAAALPCGVQLAEHLRVPSVIREAM